VLVGAETHALTAQSIAYRDLPPVAVRGKAEPLRAYEAIEPLPPPVERYMQRGGTPFVGRADEQRALHRIADAATRDRRSAVIGIAGPAGIGKSRLTAEFVSRHVTGAILVGRCVPHGHSVVPWLGLAQAIRARCGIDDDAPVDVARAALAAMIDSAVPDDPDEDRAYLLERIAPLIGASTALPRDRTPDPDLSLPIATALRRVLGGLATRQPVFVVVEDVQWIDTQLRAFIRWVDAEPWDAPVFVVWLGWPEARDVIGAGTIIDLGPMPEPDADLLLVNLLPEAAIPARVAANISSRAAGNPLFLEEIVRLLRERGSLRAEGGTWILDEGSSTQVPASVELVVAARIDNLPPDARRLIRDASVCGETFDEGELGALGWTQAVGTALASLLERDLVLAVAGDDGAYAFKHGMIRGAAYGSISRAEAAEKHLALASWIQKRTPPGGEEPVELLAQHYRLAAIAQLPSGRADALSAQAAAYLARAGERAASQRALREAETWFRQALEIAPRGDEGGAGTLLRHADLMHQLHRNDEAMEEATRAHEIARAQGDRASEAEAVLLLGRIHTLRAEVPAALARLEEADALFAAVGDERARARVLLARGGVYGWTETERMIDLMGRAAEMFDAAGDRLQAQLAYEDLAYVHTTRGGERFEHWYARSAEATARAGDPRSQAALLRTLGFHAFYGGDLTSAEPPLERAVRLAREAGDLHVEMDCMFLLGRIRFERGDLDGAEGLGEALVRKGRATALRRPQAEGLVLRSRIAMRRARLADAGEALDEAERLLSEIGAEREIVEVVLCGAQNALERGAWDEAGERAADYRARMVAYGDVLEEPRAVVLMARAHLGAGRLDEAAAAAGEAARLARAVENREAALAADAVAAEALALLGRDGEARDRLGLVTVDDAFPEQVALVEEARAFTAPAGRARDKHMGAAVEAWTRLGATAWIERALEAASGQERS
jgi:tetratricopeptide (TPR) repeat protein